MPWAGFTVAGGASPPLADYSLRMANRGERASEREREEGDVCALVLGAGRGERLGHALPKAFVPLAGATLIERSIRALLSRGAISRVLPVLAASDFPRWRDSGLDRIEGVEQPVEGGAERQDSVRAGLLALKERPGGELVGWVAVHDAARCLVAPEDVERVVAEARSSGAAILGQRAADTIKRVTEGGEIRETPPRAECWAAQTPQVARLDWLTGAMEKATSLGRLGTDDAQLLEWAGFPVRIVEADRPNPKITRPEDLVVGEILVAQQPDRGEFRSAPGRPLEAAQ